jgi:hypothetical protein
MGDRATILVEYRRRSGICVGFQKPVSPVTRWEVWETSARQAIYCKVDGAEDQVGIGDKPVLTIKRRCMVRHLRHTDRR